jgi:hypothetical protein
LKLFARLPGYHLETMKTVGKRINPAFTVVQPLPAWPVWPARPFDQTTGDRRTNVLSVAPSPTAVAAVTANVPKHIPAVANAN